MSAINHIKLSDLNKKIEDVINNNFKEVLFWIIADITNIVLKKKQTIIIFDLVEKDINGSEIIAKIAGKAWGNGSQRVRNFQETTGQKFTNNINVLVNIKVVTILYLAFH
jgi:exodeoxyribonuclease VII large subunit